ncbi:MAG: hypothetical protein MMC23_000121 [Stictis urceolatum]|nr:hypothetical protein [Stictis urceolata]
MESYLLPSSIYESPTRQVRRLKLNTIMEDEVQGQEQDIGSKRRSNRISTASPSSIYSAVSASTISSYYQGSRESREFDELYDVSESEPESPCDGLTINIKRASTDSDSSCRSRNKYPSLVIPSPRHWPTVDKFKNSAVPPTPPAKIPISPEVLSRLAPNVPMSSAPPSLDGSLTSDQHGCSTAPPTPDMVYNPAAISNWSNVEIARSVSDFDEETGPTIEVTMMDGEPRNSGVQLPDEALNILQHLTLDVSAENSEGKEMEEVSCVLRQSPSMEFEPTSATSEYSISQLSIPSPGGFFSSLEAGSRDTWAMLDSQVDIPPSSTTAEHFYNAPWNQASPQIVEHTIETQDVDTEGPPTAVFLPFSPVGGQARTIRPASIHSGSTADISNTTLEEVDNELRIAVETALDRTTMWAQAQSSYLAALRETNPVNGAKVEPDVDASKHMREDSLDSNMRKTVKFLDTEIAKAAGKVEMAAKSDPLFYQAFQHMTNLASPTDSFIHRHARFDAIQALRGSLQSSHIDQVLGQYKTTESDRPSPQRPISMMPGKGNDDEETAEQRVIAQVQRERQALEQVAPAMWIVEAMRFLSGGRLLNSPAAGVLSRAPDYEIATPPEHVRILDLGGQPQCDWAWHCAREYPNVKTYTATCDHRSINLSLRGPSNHRLVEVDNLWSLPFPNNHFDVISARSLPMFLKAEKSLGDSRDEYDKCLRECMRCLKPGGYLEFFLLDSEIVLGGNRGSAASVEFGFNLKARGYDPAPTKSWLARVRRAGLVDIKRAWMFLPMGAIREDATAPPETPPPRTSTYEEKSLEVEAVQGPVGSKADAAHISGLVGSCLWEKWLLKLQMEMGKERGLIDGVGAIVEEGKQTGAGWRCMSGWAKKGF